MFTEGPNDPLEGSVLHRWCGVQRGTYLYMLGGAFLAVRQKKDPSHTTTRLPKTPCGFYSEGIVWRRWNIDKVCLSGRPFDVEINGWVISLGCRSGNGSNTTGRI